MILNENQKNAINCIDENLQLIACAGSGKTEVITRRIINILQSNTGVSPKNIVAFTFTEKAAQNMKERIEKLVRMDNLQINVEEMFIGTIHSFCWQVLKCFCNEYENVDVLDTVKEHLFISKYSNKCGAETLGLTKSLRDAALFSECIDKMIYYVDEIEQWSCESRIAFKEYRDLLKEKHFINYSFMIYELLERINSLDEIKNYLSTIKHLVVDEYQDIDDLQECLIRKINSLGAKICVVGDDDQTIYQFRGSNAKHMIDFSKQYSNVVSKKLDTNYRCDISIIDIADRVIENNKYRLNKKMKPNSNNSGVAIGFIAANEEEQFEKISGDIELMHKRGIQYSDMAILLRKRTNIQKIIAIFEKAKIPYQADIADDFFSSNYYDDLCLIFEYVIDRTSENKKALVNRWIELVEKDRLKAALRMIRRADEHNERFSAILLSFTTESGFYNEKTKKYIDAFSRILEDFDSIYKYDSWFVRRENLKYFLSREDGAKNEYRYIELVERNKDNAVNILTVHKSKGLEYEVVIIPDLQEGFFPSSKIGGKKYYSVLGEIFERTKEKYETDLEDERKLFYVAVTRAKKEIHLYANIEKKKLSTFFKEAMLSSYLEVKKSRELE